MEVQLRKLPKSEVEIQVTVPFDEFEPHIQHAAVVLSEENEMEGFRRGKAPYEIVKKRFGEAAIYEKAADSAVKKTYPKTVEELVAKGEISAEHPPLGRPEVTITKLAPGNELEYKVKIALLPEVKLPDYKSIAKRVRKERQDVSVTDEEVAKTLEWVRESRAIGEGENKKVPELTDEFAGGLGNFPNVDALKKSIKDGLKQEKEERERQRIRARILEEIAKSAAVEVPDVLVESELAKMMGELKSGVEQMGLKWDDYISHIKKSPAELQKEWREDALNRVRSALSLREIGKLEKIQPSEEEVEERVNEFLRQLNSVKEAKEKIDADELKEYARGVLRNEKVLEFLETA